jgi:serine/threonine-protein kinase
VYSLGVVMYELLTHRKAFNGGSLAEIVDAVQRASPLPVHELRPEVPASLSAIVQEAMAREPSQRYRSARQLARDLRQWLETEGDLITDDTPPVRFWQRPLVATLGTLVFAAAAAAWWWWSPHEPPDTIAQRSGDRAAPTSAASPTDTPSVPVPAQMVAQAPANPAAEATSAAAAVDKPSAATPKSRTDTGRAGAAKSPGATGDAAARPSARERSARAVATKPTATPAAPSQGTLQLAISPWGRIEVDGAVVGITPPLARLTLPVGDHVVTIRNEDFPPFTTTVRVHADEPVVVRHRFGS